MPFEKSYAIFPRQPTGLSERGKEAKKEEKNSKNKYLLYVFILYIYVMLGFIRWITMKPEKVVFYLGWFFLFFFVSFII